MQFPQSSQTSSAVASELKGVAALTDVVSDYGVDKLAGGWTEDDSTATELAAEATEETEALEAVLAPRV